MVLPRSPALSYRYEGVLLQNLAQLVRSIFSRGDLRLSLLLCRAHRKVPISVPKSTLSYIPPWIARRDSLVS